MPALEAPKPSRAESPVIANAGRSRKLKAPVASDPPKASRMKLQAATKVLNPRRFVRVQALPDSAQKGGKVLARTRTLYRSSGPPREQVFWEDYSRRQKQLAQGHFTAAGKPYQELGEILYTDPKKLTLYALGQLAEEPVKKEIQENPHEEVAEVTANKYFSNPESGPPEAVKRVSFRETGKELRTLSDTLARSRHHVNSMKQGGEYFHILHQESQERKNVLSQQAQGVSRNDFQTPKSTSGAEDSEKEATTEHLFRQLCAIHWLLEALTLEPDTSMHSIFTCWNPKDPGGCKKTVEEMEVEKLATCMQELFITSTKKCPQKAQYRLLARKINKTSTPGISQISSLSSLQGQTPCGSETSSAVWSEDNSEINLTTSDAVSESAQAKEQPSLFLSLQKMTQMTPEAVSKDGHKRGEVVKKTGLQHGLPAAQKNYRVNKDEERIMPRKQKPRRQGCHISSFIKSKANLCADLRQKFTAVSEEAASSLHDALIRLERRQEERCYQKYQALRELKYFRQDMERMRQLSIRDKREHDQSGLNWFPVLLVRLPESVKSDHKVQKILKKLERYSKTPGLKIRPDTFLKVLADLQVWELCCPEIAAAVEFVRESVVQMPEEDFNEWFQARVPHLSAQSFTI
ncbi:coiled-coil domain-containing protein 60 isoform X2 [Pogoniulus pusillus]|uniref:coiled-coil domain-containing protein 60 isoform X2 n=1 Tax=Pogoniulus pusillus TaxID=488313 RepID=UPI0030B9732E